MQVESLIYMLTAQSNEVSESNEAEVDEKELLAAELAEVKSQWSEERRLRQKLERQLKEEEAKQTSNETGPLRLRASQVGTDAAMMALQLNELQKDYRKVQMENTELQRKLRVLEIKTHNKTESSDQVMVRLKESFDQEMRAMQEKLDERIKAHSEADHKVHLLEAKLAGVSTDLGAERESNATATKALMDAEVDFKVAKQRHEKLLLQRDATISKLHSQIAMLQAKAQEQQDQSGIDVHRQSSMISRQSMVAGQMGTAGADNLQVKKQAIALLHTLKTFMKQAARFLRVFMQAAPVQAAALGNELHEFLRYCENEQWVEQQLRSLGVKSMGAVVRWKLLVLLLRATRWVPPETDFEPSKRSRSVGAIRSTASPCAFARETDARCVPAQLWFEMQPNCRRRACSACSPTHARLAGSVRPSSSSFTRTRRKE